MKTTVEISDSILRAAKKLAAEEKVTVRALVEEGLRRVVAERKGRRRFRLRKVSYRGKGLSPGVREGAWDRIRDLIYEGRGT